mgnify:CR=1 FL=1
MSCSWQCVSMHGIFDMFFLLIDNFYKNTCWKVLGIRIGTLESYLVGLKDVSYFNCVSVVFDFCFLGC